MRNTTELGGTLSSGKRLPPRSVSSPSMLSSPVHEIRRVLIRTEEEDLGVLSARDIDNGTLDTRGLTGDKQVDNRLSRSVRIHIAIGRTYVDVSLEGLLEVGADLRENRSLGSSLGDILVL
jgi:hypothetical protein